MLQRIGMTSEEVGREKGKMDGRMEVGRKVMVVEVMMSHPYKKDVAIINCSWGMPQ